MIPALRVLVAWWSHHWAGLVVTVPLPLCDLGKITPWASSLCSCSGEQGQHKCSASPGCRESSSGPLAQVTQKEEAEGGGWHRTKVTQLTMSSQEGGTDTSRPRQEQEVVYGQGHNSLFTLRCQVR